MCSCWGGWWNSLWLTAPTSHQRYCLWWVTVVQNCLWPESPCLTPMHRQEALHSSTAQTHCSGEQQGRSMQAGSPSGAPCVLGLSCAHDPSLIDGRWKVSFILHHSDRGLCVTHLQKNRPSQGVHSLASCHRCAKLHTGELDQLLRHHPQAPKCTARTGGLWEQISTQAQLHGLGLPLGGLHTIGFRLLNLI